MEGEFVLTSVLVFQDDTYSVQPLQRGDLEACQRLMEMIPAISYSGDKPVKESFLRIFKASELQEAA